LAAQSSRSPAVTDPRVISVLLLSPQGPGEFGLTAHSWDHVAFECSSHNSVELSRR